MAQAGDNDAVMKAHKAAMTDEKNASNTINQMTMDLLNELGNPSHLPGCWRPRRPSIRPCLKRKSQKGSAPLLRRHPQGRREPGTEWTDGMRTFVRTHMMSGWPTTSWMLRRFNNDREIMQTRPCSSRWPRT